MIRYFVSYGMSKPEPRECPQPGYPNRDASGAMQLDNTHFDSEALAWDRLLNVTRAAVVITGRRVRDCEQDLRQAQVAAGEACALMADIERDRPTSAPAPSEAVRP